MDRPVEGEALALATEASKAANTPEPELPHRLEQSYNRRVLEILEKVQEVTRTGVWEFDPHTKQSTWSREMYRIHGLPEGFSLDFENLLGVYQPADQERIRNSLESMESSGAPSDIELQIVTPAGARVLRSLAFPQLVNGRVARIVGYVTDITEAKAAMMARKELEARERELESVRELGRVRLELLRSTAHELNTPLTPLRLAVAALRGSPNLDARQIQALQLIDRNVLRLASLVQDMLDAAKLQGARLQLVPHVCDLQAMVDETVQTFHDAAQRAGLDVRVDVPDQLVVNVDRGKTLQVLFNLVSNAIKYTPTGHVFVSARPYGTHALVTVSDSGLGLTASQREQLFQPFVRLHEGAGNIQGTGLGLYISKGIIELQGGRIWAESPGPGKGTTFNVSLPLAQPGSPA